MTKQNDLVVPTYEKVISSTETLEELRKRLTKEHISFYFCLFVIGTTFLACLGCIAFGYAMKDKAMDIAQLILGGCVGYALKK
jgi:hypothetical protein